MSAAAEPLTALTHQETDVRARAQRHAVPEAGYPFENPINSAIAAMPMHDLVHLLGNPALALSVNTPVRSEAMLRTQQTHGNRFVQRAVAEAPKQTPRARLSPPASFGEPLGEQIRGFMEAGYRADFRHVRLHTDGAAAATAESIQAQAFTSGQDIYFAEGKFEPSSPEGKRLIAHELAHTIQQNGQAPPTAVARASRPGPKVTPPDDPLEIEAEAAAKQVVDHPRAERALVRLSTSDPSIQRWPFTDTRTEREKIEAALKSRDPGDVKDIKDVNQASESEKLDLLRILTYQGWAGVRDEWKIEEIWRSFGDQIPRIMGKETSLWKDGVAKGADLDQLPPAKKIQVAFMVDVQSLALTYLQKNHDFIKEEMKSLGLGEETPTAEQDKRLKDIQEMARQVKSAQEVEKKLRGVRVGDQLNTGEFIPFYSHRNFDPETKPDRNLDKDEANKDRDWNVVKSYWDPVANFITKVANQYPTIYAAIQQGETFWGPDDKIGPIADAGNPAKARLAIKTVLSQTLKNIDECRSKILSNDPDYRDMMPLHAQLLAGTAASTSKADYSLTFNKWVVENDLKDYKAREFWVRLGFQTAAAVAFVVVEFATAGTATFFIAAGIGLAASGYQAYNSLDKYLALEKASKTNVKDATALVDKATVQEAGKKAIEDATAFLLMVVTVGVKLLTAPKAVTPEGCFVAGTRLLTESGSKSIEEIQVGDLVRSRDPMSGQVSIQPVTATFRHRVPVVLDIDIGEALITCSPEHPFWLDGTGWLAAGAVETGRAFVDVDNRPVSVRQIQIRHGEFAVFNVEVAGVHNYLVSECGVLVHNKAARAAFKDRMEQAVISEMKNRPGGETAEAWELKSFQGPHTVANPEPGLGPNQQRFQARFYDTFNNKHEDISVNYDPDTGNFGIIKFASGK